MRELDPKGGARYVGFVKDLLDVVAEKVGFSYSFKIASDNQYGTESPIGWTGMIGELVRKVSIYASTQNSMKFREPPLHFYYIYNVSLRFWRRGWLYYFCLCLFRIVTHLGI